MFARDVDRWYLKILCEIVRPFFEANTQRIEKMFFFHYEQPYEADKNCRPSSRFAGGEQVRYVRMRFRVPKSELDRLEKNLVTLIDTSQTALEKEKCQYDPVEDLGSRFGTNRLELALNYLDSFARMVLSMLTNDAGLEDTEKPYGVIHLTDSMIGGPSIKFHLRCGDCGSVYKVTAITATPCPTCGAVNHF